MKSIVLYTSHFGVTKRVAEAIASGLQAYGPVEVAAMDAESTIPDGIGLAVFGGPTEAHGMTVPAAQFLDRLSSNALKGIAVGVFDTRLRWPRWLSGSAASGISEKLRRAGAQIVVPPESFFIKGLAGTGGRSNPELDDGELERAKAWASALGASVAAPVRASQLG